jgi:SulP family sulfate permease
MNIAKFVPILEQIQGYDSGKFSRDLIAAMVVTIMLIPQSLAYAMLAGLPPEVGLYASILPLVAYAIFGSCRTLAVGPVAIASLMTASALAQVTQQGIVGYVEGAMLLALLSGLFLLILGVLRLGFLSHFLSHSVVVGFITASGLVIALSQLKHILGVSADGHNFVEVAYSIAQSIGDFNLYTLAIGLGSLVFLFWARRGAAGLLMKIGVEPRLATTLSKVAPVIGVVGTTLLVSTLALDLKGVAIVGVIPTGIPALSLPSVSIEAVKALVLPAIFISIIGYVESVSVGKTLSAKKQQKVDGNQELIGLGTANLAAGFSAGFPVTGGFARSVVNFDAGAETQFSGIFTAIGITLAALFLTPLLHYLPIAMLAATIIVAVLSLVNFSIFKEAWIFSKSDFAATLITVILTLVAGVEIGVASGITTSILLHLYNTSKPHIAEIGLLQNTQHFRNVKHFAVQTNPSIVSLRIDESLMFSNAGYLEDYLDALLIERPEVSDVILHCGAINTIDLSALEMLEKQNDSLRKQSKRLHFSELKVPVKARLDKVGFIEHLSGSLYLSQFNAYSDVLSKLTVDPALSNLDA